MANFTVSPISGSHSGVVSESSHLVQEELCAITLTFKELKTELVPFLKELAEHEGSVRYILIDRTLVIELI